MRFLESLIYGLISGVAEFLPVSAQAHQAIVLQLFGTGQREPLRDLLVHLALIAALIVAAHPLFSKISRERSLSIQMAGRNRRSTVSRTMMDFHLVRTATVPLVLILFLYFATRGFESDPIALSVLLIINGTLIMIPEHLRRGNKDARSVTSIESSLIGIASGLSAFPGISRVGTCYSASGACGADRQHATNWAILLSLPALSVFALMDFILLVITGFSGITFLSFLGYIVSALAAFAGGYFGVTLMRFISDRSGISAFAFYSWGMAMFVFILYLIT